MAYNVVSLVRFHPNLTQGVLEAYMQYLAIEIEPRLVWALGGRA
jgi:hypothetical protein